MQREIHNYGQISVISSIIDISGQKITKYTVELDTIVKQLDLTRFTKHCTQEEQKIHLFRSLHRTFTKIDYVCQDRAIKEVSINSEGFNS